MTRKGFFDTQGASFEEEHGKDHAGYLVIYPDGYRSWSPKKVFEAAYREISPEERKIV